MRTRILKFGSINGGILILILVFLFLYNPLEAQRINKKKTSGGTGYLEYLPLDYNTSGKNYPIIIYLHGAGEAGNGTTELSKVAKWGPLREVNQGKELCFTANGQSRCFIVIAPQTSNSELWDIAIINHVVNYALKTYRVDKSMVFLTGFSTGGTGTWRYSYSKYNMPNKLKAVAPVTGKGDTTQLCYLANNNIAVWAFHGAKDTMFPKDSTINKVRVLNECKPAPNPKAKITLVANGGHNETTWLKVYDVTHTYQNPNLYEWFLSFGNKPPVARAGPDQTITLPTNSVTLNGTKSTDDKGIKTYRWTKKSGGAATIVSSGSAITKVSGLVQGSYVFTLKVTDEMGLTHSDDVGIKVNPATNQLHVAKAGSDQTLVDMSEDGQEEATLDGSASEDSDGTIFTYSWSTEGKRNIASGINPEIMLPQGTTTITLNIIDNKGATGTDRVKITINGPDNLNPIANPGDDQSLTLPENSTQLNGSQSKDQDGDIVQYQWVKKAGGNAKIENAGSAITKVSGLQAGTYTFALSVTDEMGGISSDEITLVVKAVTGLPDEADIAEKNSKKTVTGIYPNPVDKKLTIKLSKKIQGSAIINFLDESGKLLYRKEVKVFGNQEEINLELSEIILKQGILFVRVDTENDMGNLVKLIKR